jgi:catalase
MGTLGSAMINLPMFPFKDAQAFYDNLVASEPDPNTYQPDPAKDAAFVAHFGAALFHTLIVRDGLLSRMLPGRARAR